VELVVVVEVVVVVAVVSVVLVSSPIAFPAAPGASPDVHAASELAFLSYYLLSVATATGSVPAGGGFISGCGW
jgi:hypothetical protein